MQTLKAALSDWQSIQKYSPVIHNITNSVTMQTIANTLLAIGASPIMAHAQEELAEITALSDALVINIGTLDEVSTEAMQMTQQYALHKNIPIVLDPVGAGATRYRTETAKKILASGVSLLRANASEILALATNEINTKGVDSTHSSELAQEAAFQIANQYQCVVVVTGATDVIVDHKQSVSLNYGTPLFTKVTGMGCTLSAILGAFLAINKDYFSGAVNGITLYTLAGESAAKKSQGPGSFFANFLDVLYQPESHL